MKPAIIVKRVKGKRHLQLRDPFGCLIHIGPASDVKTWRVASSALRAAYSLFSEIEMVGLKSIALEELGSTKFKQEDPLGPADPQSPECKKFDEKWIKIFKKRRRLGKRAEKELGFRLPEPWEFRWARFGKKRSEINGWSK